MLKMNMMLTKVKKNMSSHDGIHNGQVKEKEKNDTQDEMDDDKIGKKCDSLNRIHTAQQKENDIQDNVAKVDHNYIKKETKSDGIVNEATITNSDQGEMTATNSEVKPDCKGDGVGHKSITNSEMDGIDTHLDVHYKIDAEGRSDFQDNENQHARCIKLSKLTHSDSVSSSEMEISDDNSEDHTYEARSDSDNESQEFTIENTVHGHDVSTKIQKEEVKGDIPVIDITDDNGVLN